MTTNHKPTLESRRGRELTTSILHARDQPAHKQLKYRRERKGLEELKRELAGSGTVEHNNTAVGAVEEEEEEDYVAKRQRVLDAFQDDSSSGSASGGDESSDESSDDDSELLKELQKIKEEREARKQEQLLQQEQEKQQQHKEQTHNKPRKSWRQDAMFKETNKPPEKEYVNDLVRSDFHQKFLEKYVR